MADGIIISIVLKLWYKKTPVARIFELGAQESYRKISARGH
jgi:hypothetical protein